MNLILNKLPILNSIFSHPIKIIITIAITIALAIIIFFQVNSSNQTKELTWIFAKNNVSPSLLRKALSIDSDSQINPNLVEVMLIPTDKDNLYLFDLNSPRFCGIGGCIYSLYNTNSELLLRIVADSHLPPQSKFKFIEISSNQNNTQSPCLIVSQSDWIEPKIYHTEYCYFQNKFIRVNQTFSLINS